jgi:hypothetical protein
MWTKIFYKVEHLMNERYQVFEKLMIQSNGIREFINTRNTDSLFEGTLLDCETFIRLKENGNI